MSRPLALLLLALCASHGAAQSEDLRCQDVMLAADQGNTNAVVDYIEQGVPVDCVDKEGETPLIVASAHGHLPLVKALIARGANVNAQDKVGWSPLMMAAQEGKREVARELLAAKANLEARTKDGLTPLLSASYHGRTSMVALLLEAGANVAARDVARKSAYDYAKTDADRFVLWLAKEGASAHAAALRDKLGVALLGDLRLIKEEDLAQIGVNPVARRRLLAAARRDLDALDKKAAPAAAGAAGAAGAKGAKGAAPAPKASSKAAVVVAPLVDPYAVIAVQAAVIALLLWRLRAQAKKGAKKAR